MRREDGRVGRGKGRPLFFFRLGYRDLFDWGVEIFLSSTELDSVSLLR